MFPSEHNMKEREVFCPKCKQYTRTNQPNPKCLTCGYKLFTVLYSLLTGERLTK